MVKRYVVDDFGAPDASGILAFAPGPKFSACPKPANAKNQFKHFEQTPILLFNESDALIGKRINVTSSVDQMNNSMQNILLQELEDFKGILMATTNLTSNLDEAFDNFLK